MVLQVWVGSFTIYQANPDRARALLLHEAILHNQLPQGVTWADLGAQGTNVRRFAVELADAVHRVTGLRVLVVYQLIDSVCLFLTFILLFVFLRTWLEDVYCVIGILYSAIVGVLTYHLHFFHPWDRVSQLAWMILLMLILNRRVIVFAAVLAIAVTIKFDVIFLPGLWSMYTYDKGDRVRWLATTACLFLVSFGTLQLLRAVYPGGSLEWEGLYRLGGKLIDDLRHMHVAYPPLLMFGLPLALAFPGLRSKDRFTISAVLFGCMLLIVFALTTNLREVRAEVPVLFLLLPAALQNLRSLVGPTREGEFRTRLS
jgi:hypothetical protein